MTPQEVRELNESLLKKIGFECHGSMGDREQRVFTWIDPNGYPITGPIDLVHNIAACFKWLVPELRKRRCEVVSFYYNLKNIDCDLSPAGSSCATIEASADTESMALCLAADKYFSEVSK